jgi:hypothetical protein
MAACRISHRGGVFFRMVKFRKTTGRAGSRSISPAKVDGKILHAIVDVDVQCPGIFAQASVIAVCNRILSRCLSGTFHAAMRTCANRVKHILEDIYIVEIKKDSGFA